MNIFATIGTGVVLIVYLIILAIVMFFALIMYILNGIGYMKLAKKVGIERGWLGFVPIANVYLLGKFAEKDNEVYHPDDKPRNWSKILLTSSIVFLVIDLLFCVFSAVMGIFSGLASADENGAGMSVVIALIVLAVSLLLFAAAISYSVLQYIAMYKLLHLMAPEHAGWILVVSILLTSLAYNIAVLVFAFSKKFPTARMPDSTPDEQPIPETVPEE